jgi:hypothetical protein
LLLLSLVKIFKRGDGERTSEMGDEESRPTSFSALATKSPSRKKQPSDRTATKTETASGSVFDRPNPVRP